MNQKAASRIDLRSQMPETAKWIEAKRAEWGAAFVNAQLKAAMAGEPGHFYAMENGQVFGVPFPVTHAIHEDQRFALLHGLTFAVFMAAPAQEARDGAH